MGKVVIKLEVKGSIFVIKGYYFFFFLIGKQRYIKALAKRHKKVHTEYTN